MFRSKTLFVVGAGASKEASLPTGEELKDTIAEKVDIKFEFGNKQISGDHQIMEALRQHVKDEEGRPGDINPYLHAGWRICDAMPQATSIDNFIDTHQHDEKIKLCGKLAIVQSLLEAERDSLLFFEEGNPDVKLEFEALKETWYANLWHLLVDGRRKEEIGQLFNNCSLIIFNYDRCVEHFLFHALQNYYGVDSTEAMERMQALEVFHPYGVVGNLPWQATKGATPYGSKAGGGKLLSLARQIKTFTERVEEEIELAEMRQRVQEAHTIVFLGFAFHEQNMELLKPENPTIATRVFATGLGISDSGCKVVTNQTFVLLGNTSKKAHIDIRNRLTCHGLFNEFQRSFRAREG